MMLFENNNHGFSARMIKIGGEPRFVAKEVCDVLGLANSRDAVASLDEDEKDVHSVDTPEEGAHTQCKANEDFDARS